MWYEAHAVITQNLCDKVCSPTIWVNLDNIISIHPNFYGDKKLHKMTAINGEKYASNLKNKVDFITP